MSFKTFAVSSALVVATAGLAFAGGHGGNPAVTARKSHMGLYQHNIGILGAMAKGEVEYSADAATAAANNLVALSSLNQAGYWTPGTSNADLGDATRALPALWEEGSMAGQIGGQLAEAAVALAAVAGDGQEALVAGLAPVGQACGACHKEYRQLNN